VTQQISAAVGAFINGLTSDMQVAVANFDLQSCLRACLASISVRNWYVASEARTCEQRHAHLDRMGPLGAAIVRTEALGVSVNSLLLELDDQQTDLVAVLMWGVIAFWTTAGLALAMLF